MKGRFTIIIISLVTISVILVNACKKNDYTAFPRPHPITFEIPAGFPLPVYNFEDNALTEEGFQLGRKLFHDHRLSKNLDVTCASCHQQNAGYTTFDHDLGHGTDHQHTTRNVPGIFNMVWQHAFQWDGSVAKLIDQPLTCLTAPEKLGESVDGVIAKIKDDDDYKKMFGKAFGDEQMTGERISKALVQFVASLVSAGSQYDRVKAGRESFNASQQQGYDLFQKHCVSCHAEPLFTDVSYRNNGMPLNPFHSDFGRMQVTGSAGDSLKFKVPSLRNVALTAYYGHDGRWEAISEVLEHYNTGIQDGPTLDPLLKNKIPLTDLEKFYLQEFLFTLTDSVFVNNPRFGEP
ncbi:MAG: cytochrome c peroxidase [Flavitalea sp.]